MKKLLFTIALTAIAVSVSAQVQPSGYVEQGTYERITERGPYLTGRFFDNWFIGVAGGVNLFEGRDDAKGDFGKRLAPALDVSLGKWITPSVGIRLQYSGLKAHGWSETRTPYVEGGYNTDDNFEGTNGLWQENFKYFNIHADVLWNLSNAIGGYREDRFWSFVPYLGAGYGKTWENDFHQRQMVANIGLLHVLRINQVLDVTIDMRQMITKKGFDWAPSSKKLNGVTSLTAGLNFKLGPKGGFKRPVAAIPANYTPYQNRINALENELAASKSQIDALNRQLEAERNRQRPAPEVSDVCEPTEVQVFFTIDKSNIHETDMLNLGHIAETMKANSGRKFTITGYADEATGSAQRNMELSRLRAETVANTLVEKFGVNRSQLTVEWKGGVRTQSNPRLDRTVIIE